MPAPPPPARPPLTRPLLTRRAFWFLRHGETDWNARNLSQGNVEVPLNEKGLAQARQAAELLAHRGIRTVVSSPLGRARVTAETFAEPRGLPVSFDEELREVRFGEQEGKPMGDWYDDWIAGTYCPEGAEPFAELEERAARAINRALEQESPVLVVAHGGLFRAVRGAMGLPPNIRTPNGIPYFCEPGAADADPWTLTAAT